METEVPTVGLKADPEQFKAVFYWQAFNITLAQIRQMKPKSLPV